MSVMLRCALSLASLVYSMNVSATIPASVSLAELYASADQIAIVQIEKGQLLQVQNRQSYGAKFTSKVIRSFKGSGIGDILAFGPAPTYLIGNHYLVFLTNSKRPFLRLLSSNSAHQSARQEYLKSCSSARPKFDVMQMGMASMEVDQIGAAVTDWQIIWQSVVSLPASAKLADPKRDLVLVRELDAVLQNK